MSQLLKKGMPRPAGCCLRFGAAPAPQAVPLWKQKRAQRNQAMFEAAQAGQQVMQPVFNIPNGKSTPTPFNTAQDVTPGFFELGMKKVGLFESGGLNQMNETPQQKFQRLTEQMVRQCGTGFSHIMGLDGMFESSDGSAGKSLRQQQQERAQKHDAAEHRYMLMLEATAEKIEREQAAGALLDWAHGNGTPDSESFDSIALALMDSAMSSDSANGDFSATQRREAEGLTRDEVDEFNRWLQIVAETAVQLGAQQDDVIAAIDADDDDAVQKVMDALSGIADEDQAVADVAANAISDVWNQDDAYASLMTESAMKKVVRRGEVVLKRKIPKIVYLSGAQRAALKKARLKAQTASAKIMRAHSMKVRAQHGL